MVLEGSSVFFMSKQFLQISVIILVAYINLYRSSLFTYFLNPLTLLVLVEFFVTFVTGSFLYKVRVC